MTSTEKADNRGHYVLLKRDEIGHWVVIGDTTIGNTLAEIRQNDGDDGVYVEVPMRSWRPYGRETKTVTTTRTVKPGAVPGHQITVDEAIGDTKIDGDTA